MVGTVSRESRHASKLRRSSTRRPSASPAALRRSCLFFETTCAPGRMQSSGTPTKRLTPPGTGPDQRQGYPHHHRGVTFSHLHPNAFPDSRASAIHARPHHNPPYLPSTHQNTQHMPHQAHAHLFQVVHVEHARGALQLVDVRGNIPRHRDVHKAPHAADGGRRWRHACAKRTHVHRPSSAHLVRCKAKPSPACKRAQSGMVL